MSRHRFQLRRVEERGRRVAVIYDSRSNREFRVIYRLGRFRHFATDEPVTVRGLRDAARSALA